MELLDSGILGPGARVLDLGCGAGAEAIFLASQGLRVQGVDRSGAALDLARQAAAIAAVEVEWIEASVLDLPLADGSVDFAYDRGCLHLFEAPGRRLYAAEIGRVLVPGGRLLVHGARSTDEEAGLFSVVDDSLSGLFATHGLQRVSASRRRLEAESEDLDSSLVWWQKRPLACQAEGARG